MQKQLLDEFCIASGLKTFVTWYYTPMALAFSRHLQPQALVYDCMDELTGFLGAPPELAERERELLDKADVVFTGGRSLYDAKKSQHHNVHAFPSSIDVAHFAQARTIETDARDQQHIPHPRAGFFGVIDERLDIVLVSKVAELRPDMQFIFIGPVVKIEAARLPTAANIHYLGSKSYQELPQYLAGWDVAMLPFALNDSTRFISPTKTPEYLAAGTPVVSTAINDVISDYGNEHLVEIARTPEEFACALDRSLQPRTEQWREAVSRKLASGSWDKTWNAMWKEIERTFALSTQHRSHSVSSFRLDNPSSGRPVRQDDFDYLVVGAGFAGAVLAERLANDLNQRVLVIDKREHVAGNAFDFYDEAGLLIHKYGPHIFHTNSTDVVQYLSHFTKWRPFEHRVLASVDGKLLPIPINLDTINGLYGLGLDSEGMKEFLKARCIVPASIRTSEDIVMSRVGRELYEKFFRNYTRKQWGLDPSQLDASVAGRIPVRFDRDDRYFTDTFQAMPAQGYTCMFNRLLDSKNITVRTGTDYADLRKTYAGVRTIFTGPVDEYFNYKFGPLPYRSLEFKHQIIDTEQYQTAPVVNFPNEHAYTRVTEFKYLTGQVSNRTSVVFEYPRENGDPYYPIPRLENAALYEKYRSLADKAENVHFVGRLATYRYYNMDQVVAQALTLYRKLSGTQTKVSVASIEKLVTASI